MGIDFAPREGIIDFALALLLASPRGGNTFAHVGTAFATIEVLQVFVSDTRDFDL